ncbi:hypothetical protein FJR39_01705 [Dolichospermum flos-aquae UHCC 0037]|uniref:Uncharacterized protein n=1 Tax=Dolichospermum flos-aquae UHCC 0037 TaxID=2590026 RepID=A0ACC7S0Q8_DOLFA|nr:hypothetical protein [Dolichospermum flos-aquae UHCC 0037]
MPANHQGWARGKSEEGLGDFTFLYAVWFYCVHLIIRIFTIIVFCQAAQQYHFLQPLSCLFFSHVK